MFRLTAAKKLSMPRSSREWRDWSTTPLAQELALQEMKLIAPIIAKKFGHHLVQISIAGAQPLYQDSPISNRTLIHFEYPGQSLKQAIVSRPDHLAIANERVDLVILHHVLEYAKDPHQILREAKRILVSGGKLLVLGFNPWSLWSLRKLLTPHRSAPWNGKYISQPRLQDWLRLLEFKLEDSRFSFFKCPFSHPGALRAMEGVERWGQDYNCIFGASYLIEARKQIACITPILERSKHKQIISFPVAGTTTRNFRAPVRLIPTDNDH